MGELTQRRVLIVEDNTLVGMGLAKQLAKCGHTVVGQAANAEEALLLFNEGNPDLVILDIRLRDKTDGIDLAAKLRTIRRVPMIIVSAFVEPELIARASAAGVFGYLKKLSDDANLPATIEVAVRRFEDQEILAKEKEHAVQTLENRKLLDRAKGILMKRAGLTEPEAHKRLQTESQKRRINIVEVASLIIESEKLIGGPDSGTR